MESLYEKLIQYSKSDMVPMHMPGHKRNPIFATENPYLFDITEVEGVDDLHHPTGILATLMRRATALYGAQSSYLLIGGSTSGILTAISACARHGESILMARNCHKSVYHAAYLLNLKQHYLFPEIEDEWGIASGITIDMVKEAYKKCPHIRCVIITSPTYEGIVSEVSEIAAFLHEKGIPLIVDEAHGAHFPFHKEFPSSAIDAGADVVVQSLHKTLPALTQTGLLHVQGKFVDQSEIERYFSIYQTSSPSYVLMASIDQCFSFIEQQGGQEFSAYVSRLQSFYKQAKRWQHFSLYVRKEKDKAKIVIGTMNAGMTGPELAKRLRICYHIEVEMAQGYYIVAMTSVADVEEHFIRLAEAMTSLDGQVTARDENVIFPAIMQGKVKSTAYEACLKEGEAIAFSESEGRVSKEYVYIYPPGIPIIVPGEEIHRDVVCMGTSYQQLGFSLRGMKDSKGNQIEVWKGYE